MKYLLDTHIFLWWLIDDSRLSERRRKIIRDPNNFIFISVASAWEISVKEKLGKIQIKDPNWLDFFKEEGFTLLPVTLEHIHQLHILPFHHKDPFDRMLISQAITENCTFITSDKKIKNYDIEVI